jgi:hypothetical protein
LLPPRHEHDHFPVPARHGGALTVPICLSCHDFKDRVPAYNWPIEWIASTIRGCTTREARILMARLYSIVLDDHPEAKAFLTTPGAARSVTPSDGFQCTLPLDGGRYASFVLVFPGNSGVTDHSAEIGDPEVKAYLHTITGTLPRRAASGWHASVLMQGRHSSPDGLAIDADNRLARPARQLLGEWLFAAMESDPDPGRWHWVRVTLAAEDLSNAERREVSWEEIEELDRRLASDHGIAPQALHRSAVRPARKDGRSRAGARTPRG